MPNISETWWDVERRHVAFQCGTFIIIIQHGEQRKVHRRERTFDSRQTANRKICVCRSVVIGAGLWKMQRFGSHVTTVLSHEVCTAPQLVPSFYSEW